jgi:hypothetical protein
MERYFTDKARLELIAKELRQFASAAHGIPESVSITGKTLRDYALHLEQIAARMEAQHGSKS